MYCPKCNLYYRKKYGSVLICTCGYKFVFGHNDSIKDSFILRLEKKTSKNETRYFTLDEFYAVYKNYQSNSSSSLDEFFFFRKVEVLSEEYIAHIYSHWQSLSSLRSEKFIDKPSLQQPENPIGEEVFFYGVGRIIVVDQPLKVDLLVKNNKHIDKKALIISSDGYPAYLKPQLQTILHQQPNIKIGFVHNPENTMADEIMRFEKNYQLKLQDKRLWDISANKKYTKNVTPRQTDNAQNELPTMLIETSRSEDKISWFSWMRPFSSGSLMAASGKSEEETYQNHSETYTDNIGIDSSHSSGISDSSYSSYCDDDDSDDDDSDDGGFGGDDDGDDGDGE